ncbi:cytochrome C oxidase subunit II [Hyphomonas sp.]|uniref:cytochrome c oxidase subunit II n=2 Tax=Pseudomonadota TaxID=1224 RepID=UPI003263818B
MISQDTRRDLIRLAVLWVVLSVIAEATAVYFVGDYPGTASREGVITSDAVFFLLWVTIPVFVLVVLVVAYSMIRFRVSDDDEQPSSRQYQSGRAFPWGWVAMSTALNILFVVHPGITGLTAIWSMAEAATNPLEIDVTASQWEWTFDYPGQELTDQRELVVPVDTPIRFVLRSEDAIHSFWVPAWGIKKAVVPGQVRTLTITPNRIVDTMNDPLARLQCSQICGVGHADMQSVVRVVARADFDEWVEASRGGGQGMEGMGGMEMEMDPAESADAAPPSSMEGMDMPMGETSPMGEEMPMDDEMPATDPN